MKWIKCSERMPEDPGRYLCYVEEVNCLGKAIINGIVRGMESALEMMRLAEG